jgi:hypothetical protein
MYSGDYMKGEIHGIDQGECDPLQSGDDGDDNKGRSGVRSSNNSRVRR